MEETDEVSNKLVRKLVSIKTKNPDLKIKILGPSPLRYGKVFSTLSILIFLGYILLLIYIFFFGSEILKLLFVIFIGFSFLTSRFGKILVDFFLNKVTQYQSYIKINGIYEDNELKKDLEKISGELNSIKYDIRVNSSEIEIELIGSSNNLKDITKTLSVALESLQSDTTKNELESVSEEATSQNPLKTSNIDFNRSPTTSRSIYYSEADGLVVILSDENTSIKFERPFGLIVIFLFLSSVLAIIIAGVVYVFSPIDILSTIVLAISISAILSALNVLDAKKDYYNQKIAHKGMKSIRVGAVGKDDYIKMTEFLKVKLSDLYPKQYSKMRSHPGINNSWFSWSYVDFYYRFKRLKGAKMYVLIDVPILYYTDYFRKVRESLGSEFNPFTGQEMISSLVNSTKGNSINTIYKNKFDMYFQRENLRFYLSLFLEFTVISGISGFIAAEFFSYQPGYRPTPYLVILTVIIGVLMTFIPFVMFFPGLYSVTTLSEFDSYILQLLSNSDGNSIATDELNYSKIYLKDVTLNLFSILSIGVLIYLKITHGFVRLNVYKLDYFMYSGWGLYEILMFGVVSLQLASLFLKFNPSVFRNSSINSISEPGERLRVYMKLSLIYLSALVIEYAMVFYFLLYPIKL